MKKILHITKYFYPAIGGIEQVTKDVVDALNEFDVEQKIICFNQDAKQDEYVCNGNENNIDNINGVEIIRCKVIASVASQPISFSFDKYLNEIMKNYKPDIIFFHYPNPLVAEMLLKYKNNKFDLILYWHSDIVKQKILGKLLSKQNQKLLLRANKIIVTSPNYIEGSKYLKLYKNKCYVVPNCIRESKLHLTEEALKNAYDIRNKYKGKIICFALGRHVKYKGFEYLIEASKKIDTGYVFIIGSEGPLTPKLKKLAKGDEKIVFTGRLDEVQLKSYFAAMDIFCFPSVTKNEAFGVALVEGMYYGKPAITFTIEGSGVNYVNIDGVTGIECSNRNVDEYVKALKQLYSVELRNKLGQKARSRVENYFTYEQFKKNIKNVIEGWL